jgi:two-component system cell cycle response regulator
MKLLVADDDPLHRALLQEFLGIWGYEVVLAQDGNQAWQILQENEPPSLAILDWMMPGINGTEVCQKTRALKDRAYTYILLLTARNQRDDILRGLEAGADDYLTKPVNVAELEARLRIGKRIINLQAKLLEATDRWRFDAMHDALTGLLNRPAILERLHSEIARSARERGVLTALLVDIDHFKLINDNYGHLKGDAVLREVAGRMSTCLRPYDQIGRYGGEEFLVVVPRAPVDYARDVAERLRLSVGEMLIQKDGATNPITISVGLVSVDESTQWEEAEILSAADAALYKAKANGRNRVESAATATRVLQNNPYTR